MGAQRIEGEGRFECSRIKMYGHATDSAKSTRNKLEKKMQRWLVCCGFFFRFPIAKKDSLKSPLLFGNRFYPRPSKKEDRNKERNEWDRRFGP